MRVEVDTLISFIKNKIYENQEFLNKNGHRIILSDEYRKEIEWKNKGYEELIDDIYKSYDFYIPNIIFQVLQENWNTYHTRLVFWDDTELIIKKDMLSSVDGEFIFLHPNVGMYNTHVLYQKGFNIRDVKTIETLDDNYVPIRE